MICRPLFAVVTVIASLSVGYLISYQVHGKYNEVAMVRLVEEFYNENYGYTVANDTYKLTILLGDIEANSITQSDKDNLKQIIQSNLVLMETSLNGGAEWDAKTIERYQKIKEVLNENKTKP